jgi:hypothetical protein
MRTSAKWKLCPSFHSLAGPTIGRLGSSHRVVEFEVQHSILEITGEESQYRLRLWTQKANSGRSFWFYLQTRWHSMYADDSELDPQPLSLVHTFFCISLDDNLLSGNSHENEGWRKIEAAKTNPRFLISKPQSTFNFSLEIWIPKHQGKKK